MHRCPYRSCSPRIMLSDAQNQHCHPSDMIIFETSQQISLLTCAQMLNFDVSLQLLCPSNISSSTSSMYHRHKREKRRAYEQRILQMEHGIFNSVILSTGTSTVVAFKRLLGLIATKHGQGDSWCTRFMASGIQHFALHVTPRHSSHSAARHFKLRFGTISMQMPADRPITHPVPAFKDVQVHYYTHRILFPAGRSV